MLSFIVITIVFLVVSFIGTYKFMGYKFEDYNSDDWMLFLGLPLLLTGVSGLIAFYPIIALGGGFNEGYSEGYREGYLTKVSHTGFIYKTYEAQIQVGTGNMAALQEPFCFSVIGAKDAEMLVSNIGKKVRIKYTQWLIQPFVRGESGYEMVECEFIDEQEK